MITALEIILAVWLGFGLILAASGYEEVAEDPLRDKIAILIGTVLFWPAATAVIAKEMIKPSSPPPRKRGLQI